jgi:hypothetical protein
MAPALVPEPAVLQTTSTGAAKHLLLIGETGAGKSTFGCTLLGSDVFKVGHDLESCTNDIQVEQGRLFGTGTRISVADSGGLGDTEGRDSDFVENIATHVRDNGGVHGILYVHNACLTRMAKNSQEALLAMVHTLTNESTRDCMWSRTALVMTQCTTRRPFYENLLPGLLNRRFNVSAVLPQFWPIKPDESYFGAGVAFTDAVTGNTWQTQFARWVHSLPHTAFQLPGESTRERQKREFEEKRRQEEDRIRHMNQEKEDILKAVKVTEEKLETARLERERIESQFKDIASETDKKIAVMRWKASRDEEKKLTLAHMWQMHRLKRATRKANSHQPMYTATRGGAGGFCFPPNMSVSLDGGGERKIRDLRPSDKLFLPAKSSNTPPRSATYLQDLHGGVGLTSSSNMTFLQIDHSLQDRPLLITPNHLIFTPVRNPRSHLPEGSADLGERRAVLAGDLRVGDSIFFQVGSVMNASVVLRVQEVQLTGYAAPWSDAGELVVEGVLVSSYGLLSSTQEWLHKDGPAFLRGYGHDVCHLLTYPVRLSRSLWPLSHHKDGEQLAFTDYSYMRLLSNVFDFAGMLWASV